MLTDYHVHLRSDELSATAAEHFTAANAERYRTVASERGIAELGVSEHVYRFAQALEIWQHPFWRANATDDLDEYCALVREQTDLRLGVEADYIPGREEQIAALIAGHDFDYVVGSVHFVGSGGSPEDYVAVDMEEQGAARAGWSAEQLWRRYFEALGVAAASGLFDILAHPDLVKVFGDSRERPEGDLRRFYELAMEGIESSGIAVEVSTAGLRKPVAELYPAPAFLEMCVQAGASIALSSDAHAPQDIGAGYDRALALLADAGVGELCVFERRERRLEPIGAT
jgi:histidinol-phosphatase (PHP family)